jgi:hypothetical protein
MYHIYNVDNPYSPVVIRTEPFPAGGTASTTIFDFKQNGNQYMSVGMRDSFGTACGWYVYNVNNPASPQLVVRKTGTDWCIIHEHFVSQDALGNADYAWLAMSGESGSGYKVVVLDLANLAAPVETGRYQRSDAGSNNFIHDVNVVGERVFVAHWTGGMIIHDKNTLAHNVNPTPLTPINGMRPTTFMVHHTVPTTDGRFAFLEDEFLNASNAEKIKYYDIQNLSSPVYLGGIIGQGIAATSQAHNMVIKPLSPGHDLLLVGWYRAGTRAFEVDTTGAVPVITQVGMHQLRQTAGPGFGNVWGVDYLPCTLRGQPSTCIYSSDMTYGLVVDAYGYNPALDPYNPEAQITSPTGGQIINSCSFTVQGTAHDYYSGVSQVEVSTDNGNFWGVASGTTSWSYNWSIPADGPYSLRVRARDVAGNLMPASAPVAVTVAGGCLAYTPTATPTNSPTSTPTSVPRLVGHVNWQGRPAQPNALQQLPVTLTLKSGATEVNYPSQSTDAYGFFTVTLSGLASGSYDWRVKGPKYLANAGALSLSGASVTNAEMGLLRAGDADGNNVVNASDFGILRATFGKGVGDPGYDDRADFTGDEIVNAQDFNLLRGNFGLGGAPPVSPGGG